MLPVSTEHTGEMAARRPLIFLEDFFSAFEDGNHALPAGRADGNQPAPGALTGEQRGKRTDDAPAGRRERVAGGQRRPDDVESGAVDRSQRRVAAESFDGEGGVLPSRERGRSEEH